MFLLQTELQYGSLRCNKHLTRDRNNVSDLDYIMIVILILYTAAPLPLEPPHTLLQKSRTINICNAFQMIFQWHQDIPWHYFNICLQPFILQPVKSKNQFHHLVILDFWKKSSPTQTKNVGLTFDLVNLLVLEQLGKGSSLTPSCLFDLHQFCTNIKRSI